MKKKIFAIVMVLLASGSILLAQPKTPLNIQCDQTGARVFIEDKLVGYTQPNFSILLMSGTYKVRVSKEGFPEFQTTAVVGASPVSIQAILGKGGKPNPQPPTSPTSTIPVARYQLSVDANLKGAQVFVNGAYIGVTPCTAVLEQNTYAVVVKLEGYDEYSSSIKLNGAGRIFAVLSPRPIYVYIDAYNAQGASVYRDSTFVGTTPYRGSWMPGTYDIRISSPGYNDFNDKSTLRGPLTMSVALVPSFVEYELRIPEGFAMNAGKPTRFEDLVVLIDGNQMTSPFGTMQIGTHHLELFLGAVHLETVFEVPASGRFVLEPFLGVAVH